LRMNIKTIIHILKMNVYTFEDCTVVERNDFKTVQEAVEDAFKLFRGQKPRQIGPCITEKDEILHSHWCIRKEDPLEYTEFSPLFDYTKYPGAPKTFAQLKDFLVQENIVTLHRNSRAPIYLWMSKKKMSDKEVGIRLEKIFYIDFPVFPRCFKEK